MAYIQSSQLDVGVLVADPLLQRAHGIFRLHCLGPNYVGYLEVEGHVLPARHQHLSLQLRQQSFSTYRLEVVARSICSSSALLVDDPNQPAMVSGGVRLGGRSKGVCQSALCCGITCSLYRCAGVLVCRRAGGAAAAVFGGQVAVSCELWDPGWPLLQLQRCHHA